MKYPNEGARLLSLAIEQRGLTHRQASKQIGGGSVSRYLSGESKPDLERALAIEKLFDINPSTWLAKALRPGQATRTTNNQPQGTGQTNRQSVMP